MTSLINFDHMESLFKEIDILFVSSHDTNKLETKINNYNEGLKKIKELESILIQIKKDITDMKLEENNNQHDFNTVSNMLDICGGKYSDPSFFIQILKTVYNLDKHLSDKCLVTEINNEIIYDEDF